MAARPARRGREGVRVPLVDTVRVPFQIIRRMQAGTLS
jgi:hypothetical protein